MLRVSRAFLLAIAISSLALILLNSSIPAPVDDSPIWSPNQATHHIRPFASQFNSTHQHGRWDSLWNITLRGRLAAFGESIQEERNVTLAPIAPNEQGCGGKDFIPVDGKQGLWILLERGQCSFSQKIKLAQDNGYKGVLVGDDGSSYDTLVTMYAKGVTNVKIPSLFITSDDYARLLSLYSKLSLDELAFDPSQSYSSVEIGGSRKRTLFTNRGIEKNHMVLQISPLPSHTDWPLLDTLIFICFSPLCTLLVVYVLLYFRRRRIHLASILPPKYLTYLETNCVEPYLAKDGNNAECVICLDNYDEESREEVMRLPCGHLFHAECVGKWLVERKRICPICKRDVGLGVDRLVLGDRIGSESLLRLTANEDTPLLRSAGTQTFSQTIEPETETSVFDVSTTPKVENTPSNIQKNEPVTTTTNNQDMDGEERGVSGDAAYPDGD